MKLLMPHDVNRVTPGKRECAHDDSVTLKDSHMSRTAPAKLRAVEAVAGRIAGLGLAGRLIAPRAAASAVRAA